MTDLSAQIKQFIMTEVNPDLQLSSIAEDEPLIESGIIDSLGMLKIMAFLDEQFGVDLSSGEINPEHFKDVRSICELVNRQSAQ